MHHTLACSDIIRLDPLTNRLTLDASALPKAAPAIFFGPGSARSIFPAKLGAIAAGERVMVVAGATSSLSPGIAEALAALHNMVNVAGTFLVSGHCDPDVIRQGIAAARACYASTIAVIGGGTVIDAGKAVAALAHQNDHHDIDRFVSNGLPIVPSFALKWAAMPTTSGTGSESTSNSVLEMGNEKVSLRGVPPASLIVADPELTHSQPLGSAAVSAADALAQALEVLASGDSSPAAQDVALCAITALAEGIRLMGTETELASYWLSWGSLLMGIAFAHGRLGLPHALAHFCTKYGMNHGNMVGILLAAGLVVQSRDRGVVERLHRVSDALGVNSCVDWARESSAQLLAMAGLPATLAKAGLSPDELRWIARHELRLRPRLGIPPRVATEEELIEVLSLSL